MKQDELITVNKASVLLGVSSTAIWYRIKKGDIPLTNKVVKAIRVKDLPKIAKMIRGADYMGI